VEDPPPKDGGPNPSIRWWPHIFTDSKPLLTDGASTSDPQVLREASATTMRHPGGAAAPSKRERPGRRDGRRATKNRKTADGQNTNSPWRGLHEVGRSDELRPAATAARACGAGRLPRWVERWAERAAPKHGRRRSRAAGRNGARQTNSRPRSWSEMRPKRTEAPPRWRA